MESQLEQLERLARLRAQGALSHAEFEAEKARLLEGGGDRPSSQEPNTDKADAPRLGAPRPGLRRFIIAMAMLSATAMVAGGVALYALRETASAPPQENKPALPRQEAAPAAPQPVMQGETALILDDDLQFADPANCKAAPATDALFNRVLTPPNGDVANISSRPIRVGSGQVEVRPTLTKTAGENEGEQIYEGAADFPQPATWHGLHVRGITASLYVVPEAGSAYTRQIRFMDDPQVARTALGRLGFNIPNGDGYAELHDDSCGGSMQIVEIGGGSALQCSWGC